MTLQLVKTPFSVRVVPYHRVRSSPDLDEVAVHALTPQERTAKTILAAQGLDLVVNPFRVKQ